MNGFGCFGHKLLTFSLHVNRNLSLGPESFWFTRHFSEMNGLPLLTRWEQQGSGVRCYGACVCTELVLVRVCVRMCCIALVTASKAMAHEVFKLCLLFNVSFPHRLTPQSKPRESKKKACTPEHSHKCTLLLPYSRLCDVPQTWGRDRW